MHSSIKHLFNSRHGLHKKHFLYIFIDSELKPKTVFALKCDQLGLLSGKLTLWISERVFFKLIS